MEKPVDKRLEGFVVTDNKVVCSTLFEFRKPVYAFPIPALYITIRKAEGQSSKKGSKINYEKLVFDVEEKISSPEETSKDIGIHCSLHISSAMVFADLTRNDDYFTSFKNIDVFNIVFEFLSEKARTMHYWEELSITSGGFLSPRELKNINLRPLTL